MVVGSYQTFDPSVLSLTWGLLPITLLWKTTFSLASLNQMPQLMLESIVFSITRLRALAYMYRPYPPGLL